MAAQLTETSPHGLATRLRLPEERGSLVSITVFVLATAVLLLVSPAPLTYFDVSNISASATTLALAAIGLTIVVLVGGLDLSSVAIISLVNVVIVAWLGTNKMGVVPYTLAAAALSIGLGGLIGAVNGFLVGYLRLQSIVVTLGVMFICQGAALLVLQYPGGEVSYDFSSVFVGDVITGLLPAPVVILILSMGLWLYLKNTRFGLSIYAVGSDPAAAAANRVDVRLTRFLAFTAAGAFSGAAGLFLTANTGSGDPLIGAPMMLKIFAAVVLGGTRMGGGRGGALGTVFGALTLTTIVNVFLLLGVRTYYVPIAEGVVLILAVLGFTGLRLVPLSEVVGGLFKERRWQEPSRRAARRLAAGAVKGNVTKTPGWLVRNAAKLRIMAPAYVLLMAAIVATAAVNGAGFQLASYLVTLLVFASFLAILGLGQGAVIMGGGLDLSIGWAITFPAIVVTTFANGSNAAAIWAIPLALAIGVLTGLVNGILVVVFRLSPIIATLSVGSILEGVALVFSGGAPIGEVPPILADFVNWKFLGLPPIVWFLFVFVVAATLLLDVSGFGRRLKATGSSEWVAKLSGVRTGRIIILSYILSSFCAAIVGLLLAGFASNAYYDMGKPYLLASIAAVVLGGTSITGGRGFYPGIMGGALLFTALSSLLASTSLPESMRSIVYGVILLGAVTMLRERQSN
jgi:ribose transport system permease protein